MSLKTRLGVAVASKPEISDVQHIGGPDQRVFAEVTSVSSAISRLSSVDADTFRQAYQQESICYANSWLYLLRTTRGNNGEFGYKFIDQQTCMGIGYRNNTVYIVHPIGPGRFTTTRDLIYELHKRMACPIILKKVDQELYTYLSSTGLFQTDADEGLFEEEAYPEHLLPLLHLYNSEDGLYHRSLPFTRKVRRFEKSNIELVAQEGIARVEKQAGFQQLFGPNPDKYRSYLQIIKEVALRHSDTSRYKTCVYSDERGTIHGLYISELLAPEVMGLYCAVSSRVSPGITEWMDYDFFSPGI